MSIGWSSWKQDDVESHVICSSHSFNSHVTPPLSRKTTFNFFWFSHIHTHTPTPEYSSPTNSKKKIKDTYVPPPTTHCDWPPRPGSCAPRTRRRLRRVCFASRVRFAGRRASRWVTASGGSAGPRDPSRLARRLCTIPRSESAVLRPYSWGWPARPWTQSDQTDVLWSEEQHPLTWVEILVARQTQRLRVKILFITRQLLLMHLL